MKQGCNKKNISLLVFIVFHFFPVNAYESFYDSQVRNFNQHLYDNAEQARALDSAVVPTPINFVLNKRQLGDLELLLNDGFAPLTGYTPHTKGGLLETRMRLMIHSQILLRMI